MTVARIAVIGGESTGKTQLARGLATHHDAIVARDMLRDLVATLHRTPRRDEQALILELQANTLSAASIEASRTGRSNVIADPDPFMTAVYSVVYFDDDHLMPAGLASLRRARVIVWCRPDIPWVADGQMRDGEEIRLRTDAIIERALADQGLPVISTTPDRATHPAWVPDLSAFLP